MRKHKKINNAFEIFKIRNSLFLYNSEKKVIENLGNSAQISIPLMCRYWYDIYYLSLVFDGEIQILNPFFEVVETIKDDRIKSDGSWIFYFNMNYYILFNEHFDMEARKLVSTAVIKREGKEIYQNGFIGKILNSSFRLNFNERERNTPRNFRCSDLLDEHTYWEYDCGEGYIAGRFYMWNEKLVFSKSKGADVQLILIDMPTGIVDWEVEIPYGSFFFDEQNGVLTSVWGSKKEGGEFQIIHLDKRLVEIGRLEDFNMEYVRVNWQTQYLENNKYYFTETVYTTSNERPRPIKFGRFDIETKKIDFLQEVPESAGHQFAQVIYHDSKLYLRSSANELFILGEENSAMHLKV